MCQFNLHFAYVRLNRAYKIVVLGLRDSDASMIDGIVKVLLRVGVNFFFPIQTRRTMVSYHPALAYRISRKLA